MNHTTAITAVVAILLLASVATGQINADPRARLSIADKGQVSLTGASAESGRFTLSDRRGRVTHAGEWQRRDGVLHWTSTFGVPAIKGQTYLAGGTWQVFWVLQANPGAGHYVSLPASMTRVIRGAEGTERHSRIVAEKRASRDSRKIIPEINWEAASERRQSAPELKAQGRIERRQSGSRAKLIKASRGRVHPLFCDEPVVQNRNADDTETLARR